MKTNLLKIGTLLATVAAMASCGGGGSASSSAPSSSVPSSETSTSSDISSSAEPSSVPSSSAEPSSETPLSSDTEPTSEATSSAETSAPEEPSVLQILAEDLAATNVTLDYTVVDYADAKYQFMDGIALYCEPDSEGEMVPSYYHVLRDHTLDNYYPNPDGTVSYGGWSYPYAFETLTIDFALGLPFKETMASAFASVDPKDVVEEDGVYHIEAVMLHFDAALLARWWGLKFIPVNDGLEYPLYDVSFTLEGGHLATLAWSMYDQGVNSETQEIYLQEYYRSFEVAFSEYGTTSFDVPEAISGGSSTESSSGGIAPTPTPSSSSASSGIGPAPTPSPSSTSSAVPIAPSSSEPSSSEPETRDPVAALISSLSAQNVHVEMAIQYSEQPSMSVDLAIGDGYVAQYLDGSPLGYYVRSLSGVRSFGANPMTGEIVEGPALPWNEPGLNVDFVLTRNFKETLCDLLRANLELGTDFVKESEGVYTIERLSFSIDAEAMIASSGHVGEITNDGRPCPMFDIEFALNENGRLSTLSYGSYPIGISGNELVLDTEHAYFTEMAFSGYGQVVLDNIPEGVGYPEGWVAYPQVKEEIDKGAEYVYGADVYTLDWERCAMFTDPDNLGGLDISAFAPGGEYERYFTYPTEELGKTGNLIADYPSGTPFDEEVIAAILASNLRELFTEPMVEQDCYELFTVQALRYPR